MVPTCSYFITESCYFLLSPNQETSSSEQSSDEDDKENKSVRAENIQRGTSQNVKRIENVFQQSL